MKKIISYISLIYLFPHLIIYFYKREIINLDIIKSSENYGFEISGVKGLLFLLTHDKSFRALYYHRIGKIRYLISFLAPTFNSLMVNSYMPIGKGALFVHSFSTIINAKSIGSNFRITHACTVGNSNKPNSIEGNITDKPVIGNNVTIHTGSIIFGDITIGDNVLIGAGTVVYKDIPSNSTVVGNPAFIKMLNGKKVNIKL